MKRINRTTMLIFALVLSLSVTIGASLAYFSDYEEASGGATLNLGGKTEMSEGKDANGKHIVIKNTGETNMIVRVGIYGPDGITKIDASRDWILGKDGFYYYGKILKPGESTPGDSMDASINISWKGDKPDYDFEVTVVHEGSQALYDGDKLLCPGLKGYAGLTKDDPNHWDAAAVAKIKEGK